jgi:hypothetical protein
LLDRVGVEIRARQFASTTRKTRDYSKVKGGVKVGVRVSFEG